MQGHCFLPDSDPALGSGNLRLLGVAGLSLCRIIHFLAEIINIGLILIFLIISVPSDLAESTPFVLSHHLIHPIISKVHRAFQNHLLRKVDTMNDFS